MGTDETTGSGGRLTGAEDKRQQPTAGAESAGTTRPGGGALVGDDAPDGHGRDYAAVGTSADGLDDGEVPPDTRSTTRRGDEDG